MQPYSTSLRCINPRFRARKTKNCESAATVADSIRVMLLIPATAPPPKALKNVTALVMAASMSAFSQSNRCIVTFVNAFVQ